MISMSEVAKNRRLLLQARIKSRLIRTNIYKNLKVDQQKLLKEKYSPQIVTIPLKYENKPFGCEEYQSLCKRAGNNSDYGIVDESIKENGEKGMYFGHKSHLRVGVVTKDSVKGRSVAARLF